MWSIDEWYSGATMEPLIVSEFLSVAGELGFNAAMFRDTSADQVVAMCSRLNWTVLADKLADPEHVAWVVLSEALADADYFEFLADQGWLSIQRRRRRHEADAALNPR